MSTSRWMRVVFVGCLASCEPASTVTSPSKAMLGGDAVAQVGEVDIGAATVAAIASAQGVSLERARDVAVYDALFANGARADLPIEARWAESATLARALLHSFWREARTGPVTEEELAEHTARHFVDLDRPAGVRVIHAVVRLSNKPSDDENARARAHAEEIRRALVPVVEDAKSEPLPTYATDALRFARGAPERPADRLARRFEEAVKGLDHGGLMVKVEELPVLSEEGRFIDYAYAEPQHVLTEFATAAYALRERGALSPVVETSYGFHVITLLERTPEKRVPRDERLEQLTPEIHRTRARRMRRLLLEKGRERVVIARSAAAAMAEVPIAGRGRGPTNTNEER